MLDLLNQPSFLALRASPPVGANGGVAGVNLSKPARVPASFPPKALRPLPANIVTAPLLAAAKPWILNSAM